MDDMFTRYERALARLLEQLGTEHVHYDQALAYQHRLQENIEKARRHGDTRDLSAARAEVVEQLNALALEATGHSFNDLADSAPGSSQYSRLAKQAAGGAEASRGPTTNVYGSVGSMHSGIGNIYNFNAPEQTSNPLDLHLARLRHAVSHYASPELVAKGLRKLDDLADAIRQADIDEVSAAVIWLRKHLALDAPLSELLSNSTVLEEIREVDPGAAQEFKRRFGAAERRGG